VSTEFDDSDKDPEKETPHIIVEINQQIKEPVPGDVEAPTVENIAQRFGINKKTLYEWAKNDTEFSEALNRLRNVQKNDPFKTRTEEDSKANAMMIALLLLETKDRHYKPRNS
jgi:hypothetical protein